MIKLVRGRDNILELKIVATYPVGDVSGTFIAKTVSIDIPASRFGGSFIVTSSNVEAIGEGFMFAEVKLKDSSQKWITTLLVPMTVLPAGSSTEGYTEIRTTLVSIKEVQGGEHGGAGVKMYPTLADFPRPGNPKYLYLAKDTGKLYRWDETSSATDKYIEVSSSIKEVSVSNGIVPSGAEELWVDESETPEPVVMQSAFEGIEPLNKATVNELGARLNLILTKLQGN